MSVLSRRHFLRVSAGGIAAVAMPSGLLAAVGGDLSVPEIDIARVGQRLQATGMVAKTWNLWLDPGKYRLVGLAQDEFYRDGRNHWAPVHPFKQFRHEFMVREKGWQVIGFDWIQHPELGQRELMVSGIELQRPFRQYRAIDEKNVAVGPMKWRLHKRYLGENHR